MHRMLYSILGLTLPLAMTAQDRALHFTRTSGFDHNTRTASYAMFSSIANEIGITVDDDASGDPFSDPAVLDQYDVIIFSNTSGNAILDAGQRANFEQWIAAGGSVLGIHAASDTYRHSTANGNNIGTWDFYAELIGGSVQENPNHVSGTPSYSLSHIGTHPSTNSLPDPWVKNEEYYYWEGGYYGPDNFAVLQVEETVGPNGTVNSYDAARPMSWSRLLPSGSKVFYTALGHAQDDYVTDALFRTHLRDALQWLTEGTAVVPEIADPQVASLFPNPATSTVTVRMLDPITRVPLHVMDACGRVILRRQGTDRQMSLDLSGIAPGYYTVRISDRYQLPLVIQRE
ncbi:MAG: ThuA domain-containing protein [Flavobacteriales bacterium]|nr:ThuA domain-containing protein [Flavobacteriales bacterium]